MSFAGFDIIEDVNMVDEDWSRVRSPSRARRRMRYGHQQNVVYIPRDYAITFHDKMVMHPAFAAKVRRELKNG